MATWRAMTLADIPALLRVADEVHPDLPESANVFAERVKLFPRGCLILEGNDDKEICGYAISHPIRRRRPPALDSLLGDVDSDADQFYIHDLAILPRLRGQGLAAEAVKMLLDVAGQRRFPSTCLISVYGTSPFWTRFGFVAERIDDDAVLVEKLREYGDDATYMSLERRL